MTYEQFKAFIERQSFTKAKTAVRNPHEYIVRHKSVNGSDEEFVAVVEFIRENGFHLSFWQKDYIVFPLDGHFYWTQGNPIPETTILNRNDLNDYFVYILPKEKKG